MGFESSLFFKPDYKFCSAFPLEGVHCAIDGSCDVMHFVHGQFVHLVEQRRRLLPEQLPSLRMYPERVRAADGSKIHRPCSEQ